jgi:putative ABC transport system permease protein
MTLLAEFREGLKISGAAIVANKMRAALTTLGIVIGILTVSLMATAIEGLRLAFLRSISGLGSDVLFIEKFPWDQPRNAWWKIRNRRDFELADARALARESRQALGVSVEASGNWPVRYGDNSASSVWVVGNNEQSAFVRQLTVNDGRFFTEAEVSGGRPVCVLGAEIASKLFPRESGVGKRIKVGEKSFEVVGVLDKFGQFLFANMDNQVIIPITRFVSDFSRRPYLLFMIKVRDAAQMDEAKEELRGILRKLRQVPPGAEDDFAINQQEMIVKAFNRIGSVIAAVGLFVTGLSLFVGGIGIMNIMFVSVAERTREIGIRKAIGAKRRTIMIQFLLEAASICLLGGLLGLALAYAASLAMQQFLPATLSLEVAGLGLGVALLTGVIAGFMPAWRAARMNPVDALRAE